MKYSSLFTYKFYIFDIILSQKADSDFEKNVEKRKTFPRNPKKLLLEKINKILLNNFILNK